MRKDYSNLIIKNKSGYDVQITNIQRLNSKNEFIYGYICPKCGKESSETIDKIRRNKGCKYCKSNQTKLSELLSSDIIVDAITMNNSNVYLVGSYKGKEYECLLGCKKHNIEFYKKPSSFLYSKTKICPICIQENRKLPNNKKYSKSDIVMILDSYDYDWLNQQDYQDASSILILKCKKCSHISKANITAIVNGRKCARCSGYFHKTTNEFKQEVFDLVGDEYEVLGEYIDNKTHIEMKHNKCGCEWNTLPTNFLYNDRRCPKCNEPKGEKLVSDYLVSKGIRYFREYSFDDCVYKRKLRFDFYLPDFNICIEYQGKQHYVSVDYMGGEDDFTSRKIRDEVKRDYCKKNNLILIEIPYYQIQDIENILDDILSKVAT